MKPPHLISLAVLLSLLPPGLCAVDTDGKLRIIVFGGHPDDAAYKAAGTAVKWARLGHHVKLYGEEAGRAVQFAETFEVSEYGRQPSPEELRKLLPFFGTK